LGDVADCRSEGKRRELEETATIHGTQNLTWGATLAQSVGGVRERLVGGVR
jgi:hypothetical protein